MPRIRDELLDCAIYLYNARDDAEMGIKTGGSGFLVFIKADRNHYWIYAVTNAHVVEDGGAYVIRLNTVRGDLDFVETSSDDWISHPEGDDIAVCSLSINSSDYKFKAVSIEQLMTPELMQKTQIGPGDETYLIGRFINHEGRQKNLPTVRSGIISMMPWEKIETSDRGEREGFLVEAKSIGGYSGSPVFVSVPSARYEDSPYPFGSSQGQKAFLLGVDCGYICDNERLLAKDGGTYLKTEYHVQLNTGMAIVVPAWKIIDILNCDQFKKPREEYEKDVFQKKISSGFVED